MIQLIRKYRLQPQPYTAYVNNANWYVRLASGKGFPVGRTHDDDQSKLYYGINDVWRGL